MHILVRPLTRKETSLIGVKRIILVNRRLLDFRWNCFHAYFILSIIRVIVGRGLSYLKTCLLFQWYSNVYWSLRVHVIAFIFEVGNMEIYNNFVLSTIKGNQKSNFKMSCHALLLLAPSLKVNKSKQNWNIQWFLNTNIHFYYVR